MKANSFFCTRDKFQIYPIQMKREINLKVDTLFTWGLMGKQGYPIFGGEYFKYVSSTDSVL